MPFDINPPLINSAGPWATTKDDLRTLYDCPFVGAVTTRTAMLNGFNHDPSVNQATLYDARTNAVMHERSPNGNSSLNTLGYSPLPLDEYLSMIQSVVREVRSPTRKPFIISVTGTSEDTAPCLERISAFAAKTSISVMMEINLSCPNIPGKTPPAYSGYLLQEHLSALQRARTRLAGSHPPVPVGIKTSPYTHRDQFSTVIDALLSTVGGGLQCPIDFITATNTLGNCLVMSETDNASGFSPAIGSVSGDGVGGAGGAAVHCISLGNVCTFRSMLDQQPSLKHIQIIGSGGVSDYTAFGHMTSVGA